MIVPAGHSYEDQSLREYMNKYGSKDPISHVVLYQ